MNKQFVSKTSGLFSNHFTGRSAVLQAGLLNVRSKSSLHTHQGHQGHLGSTCSSSLCTPSSKPILSFTNNEYFNTSRYHNTSPASQHKLQFPSIKKASSTTVGAAVNTDLLRNLFYQNAKWRSESDFLFENNVENVLMTQKPQATLLTCCDSRAPSAALGRVEANQTFEIRNIGNQALNALGSIEYGIEVLKTPYLLIMGHTNCGAVMGALSDYRSLHSMIQRELLSLVKSIRFAEYVIDGSRNETGAGTKQLDDDYNKRINILSEINVDFQILNMLDDWKVRRSVSNGDLRIIGLMFDIHNVYGQGHGQLQFININGETNPENIRKNDLFIDLGQDEKERAITRLFQYPKSFSYRDFAE